MELSLSDDVICPNKAEVAEQMRIYHPSPNGCKKITRAVIIAAGNGSRLNGYQNHSPKPLLKVGGLPLLKRVILSAKRAGVTEFVIVIGYQAERIRKSIDAEELDVKITWVLNEDWKRQNGVSVLKAEKYVDGNFFLFMSDHIFDYRILKKITPGTLSESDGAMLCVDYALDRVNDLDDATKVQTVDNRLLNVGKELERYNAIDIGIFVCTRKLFDALRRSQAQGDESLSGGIRVLAERGEMATFDIGDAMWQDVDTVSDVKYAEKLLLRATRSPKDGFIARTINRPVSNAISKWLVKTPITPNQLSFLNFVFTVFIAWLISFGKPLNTIIAGVLFQFASIFDGCDGEVATMKLKDSKFGALFDTVMDNLSYIAFIIGVTFGAYNTTHNPWMFVFTAGLVVLVVVGLKLGLGYLGSKSGSMKDFVQEVGGLNHNIRQPWYVRALSSARNLGRRDVFSFATMLILFFGSVVFYYWAMIVAVILMSGGMSVVALAMSGRLRKHAAVHPEAELVQNGSLDTTG